MELNNNERQFVQQTECNGFTYHVELYRQTQSLNTLRIIHNKPNPDFLCKYYSLSDNSVDAVMNHYFYAPHPLQLNDKHDCSPYLIDYADCDINFYLQNINLIEHILYDRREIDDDTIRQYYNSSEKWRLERYCTDKMWVVFYKLFGIISLSSDECNVLMWTHYTQNKGFMVKINHNLIHKENLFGPYPINYCEIIEKIKHNPIAPITSILYQSNIKSQIWSYEKEWRYLYHSRELKEEKNTIDRCMQYKENALIEIHLGYYFFDDVYRKYSAMKRYADFDIFTLKSTHKNHKLKRKLLNWIVKKRIKTFQILADIANFRLTKREIQIEKISCNQFKIKYL